MPMSETSAPIRSTEDCKEQQLNMVGVMQTVRDVRKDQQEMKKELDTVKEDVEKLKTLPASLGDLRSEVKANTKAMEENVLNPLNRFKNYCVYVVFAIIIGRIGLEFGIWKIFLEIAKGSVK